MDDFDKVDKPKQRPPLFEQYQIPNDVEDVEIDCDEDE